MCVVCLTCVEEFLFGSVEADFSLFSKSFFFFLSSSVEVTIGIAVLLAGTFLLAILCLSLRDSCGLVGEARPVVSVSEEGCSIID